MLLQKALSGPLGSGVFPMDVEITSVFFENRDPNIDGQKLLHGGNLESVLRDEWSSCLDEMRKSHATKNHATKKYCPNDVVGEYDLRDVKSRGLSDDHGQCDLGVDVRIEVDPKV